MTKAQPAEYAPYYERYVSLVAEGDLAATLERQLADTLGLLRGLNEEQGNHRYAPDKWSVKQVVGHMIDTERIFAYRALCIGRNDKTALPGFEQDDYVAGAQFDSLPLAHLVDEFAAVRQSNLRLFRGFSDEAWLRSGVASGNPLSTRAAVSIIAGHELYHVAVLKQRYLNR
jgi:DinB superfamily